MSSTANASLHGASASGTMYYGGESVIMGFLWWLSLFPSQGGQSLVPAVSFWSSLMLLNLSPCARSSATGVSESIFSASARSAAPALPPAPRDGLWHLGGGVLPWQLCPGATAVLASAEDVALYPSRWEGAGRRPGAPPEPRGDGPDRRTARPSWRSRSELQGVPLAVGMP